MVGFSITVVVLLSGDCHDIMITAVMGGAWILQVTNIRNGVGKYVYIYVCLIKKCGYVLANAFRFHFYCNIVKYVLMLSLS
jgi:hypothetical protein